MVLPEPPARVDRDGEAAFESICGTRYEEFVESESDYCDLLVEIVEGGELEPAELFGLIENGAPVWSEDNEYGVHIPARGGYPPLNDEEILNLLDYLGVEGASMPGTEFVSADVSALLESLGVVLPEPPARVDRDGETAFSAVCGVRYEDYVESTVDYCDALLNLAGELDEDELYTLVMEGNPIWGDDNEAGVHIPARGGYPPLNDAEIENFVTYLSDLAED